MTTFVTNHNFIIYINKLLLVSLFYFSQVNSLQIISLGFNCTPATVVWQYKLRTASYPFDWIWSHHDQLYHALEDDLEHFCEPESLQPGSGNNGVLDYYGFQFMHDFPTENGILTHNWKDSIPIVYEKYQRRIHRFKEICSGRDKVYFIRYYFVTKAQAITLRNLLIKKYPNLDFTLIVVGPNHELKYDWQQEKIINFHYDTLDGNADDATWQKIFTIMGLI